MPDQKLLIHDDESVTPFWNRIPRFFLFPLQAAILLVLVPLALACLLGVLIPVPTPFDFLIAEGLVWLAAFRHAFRVLDRTSRGLLRPDQYDQAEVDPERENLPWKMLGILLLWGFIIGLLAVISTGLALFAQLFFTVAFPACVMALTVTNSLWLAVNPLLWISIMRSVGKAYLALFLFLMLLSGGATILIPMMGPLLHSWVALPLINFIFLYFNLIMFNMMGYVLYQYHRVLGLPVSVEFAEAEGKKRVKTDEVGDEIARRVADGDLAGAVDAAYEQQRVESDNVAVQERYHKLLLLAGKTERVIDHGRRYLAMLVRTSRADLAVPLLKQLRQLDAGFMVEEPGYVLPLAEAARRSRDYALAMAVMRSFDKRHPRHADLPAVQFLSAQILSEHFRKDELAAAMLKSLRAKFPDHPLAAQAASYLQALERLRQAAAPAAPGR